MLRHLQIRHQRRELIPIAGAELVRVPPAAETLLKNREQLVEPFVPVGAPENTEDLTVRLPKSRERRGTRFIPLAWMDQRRREWHRGEALLDGLRIEEVRRA